MIQESGNMRSEWAIPVKSIHCRWRTTKRTLMTRKRKTPFLILVLKWQTNCADEQKTRETFREQCLIIWANNGHPKNLLCTPPLRLKDWSWEPREASPSDFHCPFLPHRKKCLWMPLFSVVIWAACFKGMTPGWHQTHVEELQWQIGLRNLI